MSDCRQELCENWSGDGNVCPCALFDLEPPERGKVCFFCGESGAQVGLMLDGDTWRCVNEYNCVEREESQRG